MGSTLSHFKQSDSYGCGLYAIANTFRQESIITPLRLEESKTGNHTGQLNKWLIESGNDFYLEPMYFDVMGNKLPKWAIEMVLSGQDIISIPLIFDIQETKKSKTHFIAADLLINGDLLVLDSAKESAYYTTIKELNKNNYRVFGVWYFRPYEGEGRLMRYKNNG